MHFNFTWIKLWTELLIQTKCSAITTIPIPFLKINSFISQHEPLAFSSGILVICLNGTVILLFLDLKFYTLISVVRNQTINDYTHSPLPHIYRCTCYFPLSLWWSSFATRLSQSSVFTLLLLHRYYLLLSHLI